MLGVADPVVAIHDVLGSRRDLAAHLDIQLRTEGRFREGMFQALVQVRQRLADCERPITPNALGFPEVIRHVEHAVPAANRRSIAKAIGDAEARCDVVVVRFHDPAPGVGRLAGDGIDPVPQELAGIDVD